MYNLTASTDQESGCGLAEFSASKYRRRLQSLPSIKSRATSKLMHTVISRIHFLEGSWNGTQFLLLSPQSCLQHGSFLASDQGRKSAREGVPDRSHSLPVT